jgi:hypothetical protein
MVDASILILNHIIVENPATNNRVIAAVDARVDDSSK